MHPLIENNLEVIRAICREFGLEKLEVFGSIMTDDFRDDSDVDFIAHLPEEFDFGPWGSRFFEIEERLSSILGRDVDVVTPSVFRNPWLNREATKTRVEIFDASKISEVA